MRQMHTLVHRLVLGLLLTTAAGTPLSAQTSASTPAGAPASSTGAPTRSAATRWDTSGVLLPHEYRGVALTAEQQAALRSFAPRNQTAAAPAWDSVAAFTAEQRHVVARNRQVLELYEKMTVSDRDYRADILLGVTMTDQQLAALKKLLTEERARREPFPKARQAIWASPASDTSAKAVAYKVIQQSRVDEEALFLKTDSTIYALLTPEQQRVAALTYDKLKAFHDEQTCFARADTSEQIAACPHAVQSYLWPHMFGKERR